MDTIKESPPVGYKPPRITPEWDYGDLVKFANYCYPRIADDKPTMAYFIGTLMYITKNTANPFEIIEEVKRQNLG